jgi:hypothetical protein
MDDGAPHRGQEQSLEMQHLSPAGRLRGLSQQHVWEAPVIHRLALLLCVLVAGCETDDRCAGVADLARSPAGLTITQQEHSEGWGHAQCFQCHQAWRIHRVSCSSFGDDSNLIDLQKITDQVDPADTTTCIGCHGANGVPGWDELLRDDEEGR